MEPDGARPRRPQGEALHRAGGGAIRALLPGDDRVQAAHIGNGMMIIRRWTCIP